jgi:hypothetical protein
MTLPRRVVQAVRSGSFGHRLRNRLRAHRGEPRVLCSEPRRAVGDYWASRRINRLANLLGDTTAYLEVGVARGLTLEAVDIPNRTGVDPRPQFSLQHLPTGVSVFVGPSDDFFARLDADTTFDIIFLDGLHTYQQTYRDLIHSLRHTAPGGVILIDDVVPCDEVSAISDQVTSNAERNRRGLAKGPWQGDVFRLIAVLRDHHIELDFRTIVGSGNEQTIVWRRSGASASASIADDLLGRYGQLSYHDVFSAGVPEWFRPGSEDEVIEHAVQSVRRNLAEARPAGDDDVAERH